MQKRSAYKRYDAKKLTAEDFDRLIPRYLYKYRTANDCFFQLLETNSLWFSRPMDFNDPLDCRLNISMGKDTAAIKKNLRANNLLD